MQPSDRLWVPIDVSTLEAAKELIGPLVAAGVTNFKIGLELTTATGSIAAVDCVRSFGTNVWYDGKFCDIPNTVGAASKAVVGLGVSMFNVHASSGKAAIKAAADNKGSAKLLAVTMLTSLEFRDVVEMWYPREALFPDSHEVLLCLSGEERTLAQKGIVYQMAWHACNAGADGVVCSPP